MNTKTTIDTVVVYRGTPEKGNPYAEGRITGEERDEALKALKNGTESPYTFWYAPERGGTHPLTKEQVDWDAAAEDSREADWQGEEVSRSDGGT